MKQKCLSILVLALWLGLAALAWISAPQEISDAERRPLAQMPQITLESVMNGSFMDQFEAYCLDQFPLRDTFRSLKSRFHLYVLGQKDSNGIYIADGYAAQTVYPLNEVSVNHALNRFQMLYENYLADSRIYMAVVPDKGYYLAESSGHLSVDYDALYDRIAAGMPWAEQIDLRPVLKLEDYYRTDTHWRQEQLLPAAAEICQAMGVDSPKGEDYTGIILERPFYGVYYGQAALPMEPDSVTLLSSPLLENCSVYDHETGKTLPVYDLEKLDSRDLYDVYLSGAKPLLTIHNPAGDPERELIVFRDSFGSSMIPLLIGDYGTVTVVDTRYISPELLPRFLDFHGQDVLMLYSTLILNNSSAIK